MATKSKSTRTQASFKKLISGRRVNTNHKPVTTILPSLRRNCRWRFRDTVSPEKLVDHLQFMRLFPTLEPSNRLPNWGDEEIFAVGQKVQNEILARTWRPRLPLVAGSQDDDPHDLVMRRAVDQAVIALTENMLWQLLEEVWPPAVMTRRGRGIHSQLILLDQLVQSGEYRFGCMALIPGCRENVTLNEVIGDFAAYGVDEDLQSVIEAVFKANQKERSDLTWDNPLGSPAFELHLHRAIDAREEDGIGLPVVNFRLNSEVLIVGNTAKKVRTEWDRTKHAADSAGMSLFDYDNEQPLEFTRHRIRLSDFFVGVTAGQLRIEFEVSAYRRLERDLELAAESGNPPFWVRHEIEQWMAHFVPGFHRAGHSAVIAGVASIVDRAGFKRGFSLSQFQAILEHSVRSWEAKRNRESLAILWDD